ncbi:hypothetical protein [Vibrio hyugaensis]|uniref:hypothetical protein n=2 Tax=Vibrio hyugaensis TaxID=1534743 RepID=UPI003D9FC297
MDFSEILYGLCVENNLSNNEAVRLLHNHNHNEFCKLDSVTFSRWKCGYSKPAFYKQLYVVKYLGGSFYKFILENDFDCQSKLCMRRQSIVRGFIRSVDFSMNAFSYGQCFNEYYLEISKHSFAEHQEIFGRFYRNIDALEDFKDEIYKKCKNISYEVIIVKDKDNIILGHLVRNINLEQVVRNQKYFIDLHKDKIKKSVLINLAYYQTSKIFFEIIVYAIANYVLDCINDKEVAYVFVPSLKPILRLCESIFEAKVIKCYPSKSGNTVGVYLMEFDIMKIIASPIIIKELQKSIKCVLSRKKVDYNGRFLSNSESPEIIVKETL